MSELELVLEKLRMSEERAAFLKERLDHAYERLTWLENFRRTSMSEAIRSQADVRAVVSMMVEMTAREGLSKEHVEACFEERGRYYLDLLLQTAESISPSFGSQIDDRSPEQIPTETTFRPLFGQSSSQ